VGALSLSTILAKVALSATGCVVVAAVLLDRHEVGGVVRFARRVGRSLASDSAEES